MEEFFHPPFLFFMRKTAPIRSILAIALASCSSFNGLDYVDPLIGTEGDGTEYGGMMPYVGVPFGSADWVPMTRLTEVGTLSYNSSDTLLLGFIGTRQPAIWMGDWGQVSFQPQTGEPVVDYASRGQRITREEYTPYLSIVEAGGIRTRYSGLEHSAVFEFSAAEHLIIDVSRIPVGACSDHSPHPGHVDFSEDGMSISGWNSDRFDASHTSPKPNFRGYFHITFSRPYAGHECTGNDEDEAQCVLCFGPSQKPLIARIGLSLISVEQAKANLEREICSRDVDDVADMAKMSWQREFDKLRIEADDDVKTIFYTGLYHSLLYPREIDEYGRYYSAFDDSVHDGIMYNCWSMWDTYRAEHPLLTMLVPERIDDMMQSLVEMYHEGGRLPKWPNPSYTGIMVGSPAETILAEAFTKGFRGFDLDAAYEAVRKNAMEPQPNDRELRWQDRGDFGDTPETRAGLSRYMELGYVAADETNESVSRTQDFGLQDLAAAVLAEATGHLDDAEYFRRRSNNYRNLWNDEAKLFLPRNADGSWVDPLSGPHYTECSPQTAVWAVPYDVEGLSALMGGNDVLESRLDSYFKDLFWKGENGNRSIHGNETSHHVAYLYNRIGKPEKTQLHVREILSRCYSTDRKGFDGNEDCGQMSAWYIMSSLGLYMLNPSDGWYELGAPCVSNAMLTLQNGHILTIKAKNLSDLPAPVKQVTFNGKVIKEWRISHAELAQGGELVFEYEKPGQPEESGHVFSMSCKVTSCNGALSNKDKREEFAGWCKENHITKLWLESYRHGETVPSSLLRKERNFFRRHDMEVCGMITPTCLNAPVENGESPIETCWSDPAARKRLSKEIQRAAKLFDTIIIDDFLFLDHDDDCPSCSNDKAKKGIEDWEEYRRALLMDVCREDIIEPARKVNPDVQMIIKYPCWWRDWEKRGYSPSAQAELFGECWIGTETRDANPDPLQACWIVGYTQDLTGGRCSGGWYDALDSTPQKFIEQAYYTILGGAKESLIHCYDYILSDDPGITPYGEKSGRQAACKAIFEERSDALFKLAKRLEGAEVLGYEKLGDGSSLHTFRKDGQQFQITFTQQGCD